MPHSSVSGIHPRPDNQGHPIGGDIGLYGVNCRGRSELERFIAVKYRQVHDADLNEYLPLLLGIHDKGELMCAAGFRPGLHRPLFLEQYLDGPIEQQVAILARQPVDRCSLVEIGNLAIARHGYGPVFMVMMAAILAEASYEWMIFTVTDQVERLIRRLGLELDYLAVADANRLNSDQSRWGRYYENNPRVLVGNLKKAMDVIAQRDPLYAMVAKQQAVITQTAHSLRDYCRLGVE